MSRKKQVTFTGKYQVGDTVKVENGGNWVQPTAMILEVSPEKQSHNYRVGVDPEHFARGLWFSEPELHPVSLGQPEIVERTFEFGIGDINNADDPYYEMAELLNRPAPKPASNLVKCDCGHSVPRRLVMSASLGSACPDCYDRMSG